MAEPRQHQASTFGTWIPVPKGVPGETHRIKTIAPALEALATSALPLNTETKPEVSRSNRPSSPGKVKWNTAYSRSMATNVSCFMRCEQSCHFCGFGFIVSAPIGGARRPATECSRALGAIRQIKNVIVVYRDLVTRPMSGLMPVFRVMLS